MGYGLRIKDNHGSWFTVHGEWLNSGEGLRIKDNHGS